MRSRGAMTHARCVPAVLRKVCGSIFAGIIRCDMLGDGGNSNAHIAETACRPRYSLSGQLYVWLVKPRGPGPTATARPDQPRLARDSSSTSWLEGFESGLGAS